MTSSADPGEIERIILAHRNLCQTSNSSKMLKDRLIYALSNCASNIFGAIL
ncbi:hypothetical protein [Rubritalea tangerina]|uniref:hypothetical protein n=1 Tax=Rubritalea tangerina TaxID=430798 RepID=UPI003612109D